MDSVVPTTVVKVASGAKVPIGKYAAEDDPEVLDDPDEMLATERPTTRPTTATAAATPTPKSTWLRR
jgi:hypothetical protein